MSAARQYHRESRTDRFQPLSRPAHSHPPRHACGCAYVRLCVYIYTYRREPRVRERENAPPPRRNAHTREREEPALHGALTREYI